MKVLESKYIVKIFNWTITSIYRIITASIIIAFLLVFCSIFFNPVISGLITALIFLWVGFAAYSTRHSAIALNFPGVDRFFQQVPCYCTIQNRDMKIIRTNKLFRQDFGSKLGELCYEAYKGSNKICNNCPVIKTFADGETHSAEETVITKHGKEAQMLVYTTPVKDEEGKIVGVMEMSTNITEIKELQDQIEASRREYMDLFEGVPCFISILDENLRIKRANRLFQQEFGDQTGKYCFQAYHKRDTICDNCHVKQTFEDGKIHSTEKTVLKNNGEPARLIVYSSPIYNGNGELSAVIEMATDITEVKKLQHELTYMGKTIALMAHRIKNILMGLEGGIFVVETGMEQKNDAMIQKGWGMIQRNVSKVSGIVKDLLYCSKEREMNFQQIDPVGIVRNVYELFEGKAKKENIDLVLDIPDKMPEGRFDPDALHSLLSNMVINAVDACKTDSTTGKDTHFVTISGKTKEDGRFIFEVADNGPGIPGAVGECVFEDFFSTKGREGTGLGLLVAQKVIEEHGGTITFQSKEGEGTTFRAIFLPHSNQNKK